MVLRRHISLPPQPLLVTRSSIPQFAPLMNASGPARQLCRKVSSEFGVMQFGWSVCGCWLGNSGRACLNNSLSEMSVLESALQSRRHRQALLGKRQLAGRQNPGPGRRPMFLGGPSRACDYQPGTPMDAPLESRKPEGKISARH